MSMSLPNQWCSGQILKARSQIGGPRVLCPQMSFSWHVLETSLCKQCWVHGTCSHPMAAESLSNKCLPCARPCFRDIRSEATSYNRHDSTTYVLLVAEARDARACWRRGCGYQPVTRNMKFGRRSYITRQQRMFMVMSEWSGPHLIATLLQGMLQSHPSRQAWNLLLHMFCQFFQWDPWIHTFCV